MLGDLRGINCEEERQFDRYIPKYVVVTFLGEGKILVLHMQSLNASVCVHQTHVNKLN